MDLYGQFPILKTISLFSQASPTHAAECFGESDCALCEFSAGEILYSSDTKTVCVGVLLSGSADIYTQGTQSRTLLKTAVPGEMFGIANLYATDDAFPTVICAKGAVRVLFLEGEAFRRFIETDAAVLRFYLRFLSKKIVYLNRKIATFTAGSAEHRLALFLLENHKNGKDSPAYSMTKLADALGLGRASLYRAVDKLVALSLIEHQGGRITLLDPEAIKAFSKSL